MESDVFSINRFWRYFKFDFDAFVSRYGISLLVMSTMAISTELFNGLFSLIFSGDWHGMWGPVRGLTFFIITLIVLMSSPAKMYGYITDRREGSAFLMMPASRLEKYLSMILISGIVVPLIYFTIYMGLDVMICMIDPTCGQSIFSFLFCQDLGAVVLPSESMAVVDWERYFSEIKSAVNPYLMFDDIFQATLFFLLGALIFKSSKTGKTLGCLILFSISLEAIITPIIGLIVFGSAKGMGVMDFDSMSPDQFGAMFPFFDWTFHHLRFLDTAWDVLMNCLLLFLIWLRLKKIKH